MPVAGRQIALTELGAGEADALVQLMAGSLLINRCEGIWDVNCRTASTGTCAVRCSSAVVGRKSSNVLRIGRFGLSTAQLHRAEQVNDSSDAGAPELIMRGRGARDSDGHRALGAGHEGRVTRPCPTLSQRRQRWADHRNFPRGQSAGPRRGPRPRDSGRKDH